MTASQVAADRSSGGDPPPPRWRHPDRVAADEEDLRCRWCPWSTPRGLEGSGYDRLSAHARYEHHEEMADVLAAEREQDAALQDELARSGRVDE